MEEEEEDDRGGEDKEEDMGFGYSFRCLLIWLSPESERERRVGGLVLLESVLTAGHSHVINAEVESSWAIC